MTFLEEEVPDTAETLSGCWSLLAGENGGHMQIFSLFKAPIELFFSERVVSPLPHEYVATSPGCADNELMITQYDVLSLLREMVMTCGGKARLKGPHESFWGFLLFPSYKM